MLCRRRNSITQNFRSRTKFCQLLLGSTLVFTIVVVMILGLKIAHQPYKDQEEKTKLKILKPKISTSPKSLNSQKTKIQHEKLIMLWTPMFGQRTFKSWKQATGLSRLKQMECPYKCNYTVDQIEFGNSDALIYHGWPETARGTMYPFPSLPRNPDQIWIYLMREPPLLYNSVYETLKDSYDFNWTMTFRKDSDIYFPYGEFEEIPMDENGKEMERIRTKANSQNRNSLAVALISECNRPSGREEYIMELRKSIPIDVYGSCGNLTCHKKHDCYKVLAPKYKFWLAFENSLCLDYVTEKLFSPLENGIVPVYLGHPKNLENAPINSYIHTKDFESPEKLGKYLLYLDANPEEYLKYFLWRKSYRITTDLFKHWCKLCQKLHEIRPENHKTYRRIADWFIRNNTETSVCKNVSIKL